MTPHERPHFIELLRVTMMAYGKAMPEAELVNFWWEQLSFFPMQTVEQAMAGYRLEERNFAPIPNAIIARCVELDGRPSADEAWATALESCDEGATVVWTEETAMALRACAPILHAGDKIGARVAFIKSYNAKVLAARSRYLPAKWIVSLGADKDRQQLALKDAVRKNRIAPDYLLAAPEPKPLLLPGAARLTPEQERARDLASLARLKEIMSGLESAHDKMVRMHLKAREQQQEKDRGDKELSQSKVAEFIDQQKAAYAPV
jgi:hypothetical protein